jgi:predicted metal-binding membrane protein
VISWRPNAARLSESYILALILCASALLLIAHQSWNTTHFGRVLLIAGLSNHWPHNLTFMLNWTLMCGAMMLPTSAQMVAVSLRYWQESPQRARLAAIVMAGFLLIWLAAGVALVTLSYQ